MIVVLGPTASGKTALAVAIAQHLEGEIISADSRQVYKGMDIGTGKDLHEYRIGEVSVPYHMIDIMAAGEEYTLYQYLQDVEEVYKDIIRRSKMPILCGGSGMYLEAVIKNYRLPYVPPNSALRQELSSESCEALVLRLSKSKILHNKTDITSRKRLIRAIEIAESGNVDSVIREERLLRKSTIFGIYLDRETRRRRITQRLEYRLENGLIEEVEQLLSKGITPEKLTYYGLEYKFVTQYILGVITFNTMKSMLNTAIHQFAKRQMTWFRGMEKRGLSVIWVNGINDLFRQREEVLHYLKEND